jgi:hypothetical protein
MRYQHSVACRQGKILREQSERVVLPFGSEYSVLLKNLDSVRVQAKVSVDGKDATEGTWLVIEPNSSIELERFIRNGNLEKGNRFKFIERTNEIENARGVKEDDGLIRVEFKKEYIAPKPIVQTIHHQHVYYYGYPWYPIYRPYWNPYPYWGGSRCNSATQTSGANTTISAANTNNTVFSNSSGSPLRAMNKLALQTNDAGITVPGSESNQKFHTTGWFATESESEVIVLHLVGRKGSEPIKRAVVVSDKPACVTCHKVNKANSKFCSRCGTALQII